jgi:ATP-binding cassette, subfamily F, member 3
MLSVSNLSKSFGEQSLFSGLTFNVGARDRIAIIGPNGSGKTTIFEILAGNIAPDSGTISKRRDLTIGYARQEVSPYSSDLLLDHVIRASSRITGLAHRMQVLRDSLAEGEEEEDSGEMLEQLGELQHQFEAAGGYNVEHEAEIILCGLGFKKSDFYRPLKEFSGGWLVRVSLSELLIQNPDLLILDEPTNHLDLESCIWFENYLKTYQGAVLVTSHDRAFLNRVARKIISLEADEVIYYPGRYDEFVLAREKDLEIRAATARRQDLRIQKEMRFIERFRYKATKAAQVQERIKKLGKIERIAIPRATKKISFNFPQPPRSGNDVISLVHIRKSYDSNVVYSDLNLALSRGDRVALVGANGAGKTTLLKVLAGVLPFDSGERKLGSNVTTAYYAQYQLELLQSENSLLDEIRRVAPEESEQALRGLLGAFLFSGDDVYKKVQVLSGGEKARLSLAKMLLRPANFLLMDEPTNHLDIASREILTDALEAYHGTLCFITHDRTLIRDIANKIVDVCQGEAQVYTGSYDEYLEWKERAEGDPGVGVGTGKTPAFRDTSPRAVQHQRKMAEGELRNQYHRQSAPIKKRISEIEASLEKLDAEFRLLESDFASPGFYRSPDEITRAAKRHHELKESIPKLTEEWASLSHKAEQLKQQYESEKQSLLNQYQAP